MVLWGSKTAFMPIFDSMVTLTFEAKILISSLLYHIEYFHPSRMNSLHAFWSNNENKCQTNGQKDMSHDKGWGSLSLCLSCITLVLYPTLEAEPPVVGRNTQDRVSKQSNAVLVYCSHMLSSTSDEQNPVFTS